MLRPFCRNLSPAGCILQIVDQSIRYKSNLINQPPTRILEKTQRRTCAAEVPETGGFSTAIKAQHRMESPKAETEDPKTQNRNP